MLEKYTNKNSIPVAWCDLDPMTIPSMVVESKVENSCIRIWLDDGNECSWCWEDWSYDKLYDSMVMLDFHYRNFDDMSLSDQIMHIKNPKYLDWQHQDKGFRCTLEEFDEGFNVLFEKWEKLTREFIETSLENQEHT